MLILLAVACIIYYVVRYRYLNVYERLRPEPPRKEPTVDLFPDSRDEGSKTGLHNYLDEFLSAIKMFGYLERPVFHELTRHMQTRRVAAGDTMLMEEEDSYCLVVDGKMQIFVRSNVEEPPEASNSPDDLGDSYRLLTEVTNGAPLSSLFSVLSLFTEHIDIWDAVKPKKANVSAEDTALLSPSPMASATASPAPFEEAAKTATAKPDSGRPGTQRDNIPDLPKFPLLSSEPGLEDGDSKPMSAKENSPAPTNKRPAPRRSVHPSIVARAVEDTTVAVIPASAFRRLSKTFPKASAHIVHVILARLQRVTFATGFRYLGLSRELVHMERMLNESLSYDLPSLLRNSAVQKLSERAKQEYAESKVKGFPIIVSRANGQRKIKSAKGSGASSPLFKPPTSPGDILSAADPLRHPSSLSKSTKPGSDAKVEGSFAKEIGDFDEDSAFRDSIRESMFKTLGIDEESRSHNVKMVSTASVSSVEASPRLLSYDSYRQRAVFSNAFGHMGPLETSADDESETNHSNVSVQSHVENDLEILFYPAGSTVIEQNQTDAGLFYVVDGFLDVTCPDALKDRPGESSGDHLFMVKPGGITGYQSSISGHKSFIQVIARSDCLVGRLSNECLEKIMDKQPQILLTLAKRLIELLPPMVLHLDFALEWVNVNAGQVIYQEGDPSDSIYIVLNGRLRTIHEKPESGSLHVESEYGHGDSIGELEVLTEIPRGATLHAIRDSELARFPSTLFNALALEYPQISVQLSRVIAHRVSQTLKQSKMQTESLQTSTSNLKTIGILPVATGAPIRQFAAKLHAALKAQGSSSIVLNQTSVLRHLGRHAFSRIGKLKLQGYLADLEEKYDIILYVADTSVSSPWTHTCIGQADLIFEVTASDADIGISEFERFLVGMKTTARKELVLLHRERYCPNGVTRQWLQNRIWIHSHHHVQMDYGVAEAEQLPHALRPALVSLKSKVQVLQSEISKYTSIRFGSNTYTNINKDSTDFSRIARRLTGRVIGLVLGGGGARGISQLGVLTAFEEAGIPIDIVGGTSIGAFNGGLYAQEAAVLPVYGRAKKFCGRMASMWRYATLICQDSQIGLCLMPRIRPRRIPQDTSSIAAFGRHSKRRKLRIFGCRSTRTRQTSRPHPWISTVVGMRGAIYGPP